MPTALDFIRARVVAYKSGLEGKPASEKKKSVSIQFAKEFNSLLADIKKESAEAAPHLPQPIYCNEDYVAGPTGVSFLELELMLNQVIAVLDVVRNST